MTRMRQVHQPIVSSVVFLLLLLPVFAQAQTALPAEKQKIQKLIQLVADLKNVKFVRNGWTYNADTAATFMRLKWEANGSSIKTARDFIDRVASFSGTSGKPYLIRMKDGTEITSREFLLGELKKLELAITDGRASGG